MAIVVPVISTFDAKGIRKAIQNFKNLEGGAAKTLFVLRGLDQGLTTAAKNIAKYGAAAAGAASVIGYKLVQAGSDLEESQSKVGVVFAQNAEQVRKFAESSATNLGISEQKALEAAGTYGNLLQAFGLTRDESTKMSTSFVQLAADLASFNNTSIDDALLALRSGLSGETEPLKRFGVALNDVRLKQEALNLGLYSGKGQLDVTAKSQAAFALIIKDTALAQGDFVRTSGGAANQQKILAASFQNVAADLGTALIPMFKNLVTFVNEKVLPIAQQFADVVGEQGIGGGIKYLGGELLNFLSGGNKFKDLILAFVTVFAALKLVITAATIAQNLFNVSLFANPIGIVIAAAIALAVAVVALYVRFEGFRKVVNFVINAVIGYFEFMVNMWIKAINLVIKGINLFGGILRAVGIDVPKLGEIGQVTFGRIGQSAAAATKQVNEFGNAAEEARFKALGDKHAKPSSFPTPTPTGGGGGGGESPIEKAKRQMKEYMDALKGVKDAQTGLKDSSRALMEAQRGVTDAGNAVKSAQEKLRTAMQNTAKAQEHFNKVTQGYGKDSEQGLKQLRAVEDAQRRLAGANRSVADSVRSVQEAEANLKRLRQGPTARDVETAEIGLTKKKFDVEQAVFAVAEAEKDLAELRATANADPTKVRLAEIRLQEAKFAVRDATLGVSDAEKDLQDLRTNTPTLQEIEKAERELEDAKLAQQEAVLSQNDAQEALNKETAIYNIVVYGAKEGTEEYADALQELTDAKRAQEEAADDVVEALEKEKEAIDKVTKAQEDLRTATWAVFDAEKALKELRSQIPASIRQDARRDFTRRETEFAPGVSMPDVSGMVTLPDFVNLASSMAGGTSGGTTNNFTVNSTSLNPADAADYVVDALRAYERSNGFIPVRVDSTVYAI